MKKRVKSILGLWVAAMLAGCLGLATAYLHLQANKYHATYIEMPDGQVFKVLEYSRSLDAYRIGEGLWVEAEIVTTY